MTRTLPSAASAASATRRHAALLVALLQGASLHGGCVRLIEAPAAEDGAPRDAGLTAADAPLRADGGAADRAASDRSPAPDPDGPPGLYGPCGAGGCLAAGLSCLQGEIALCLRDCSDSPEACGADEECQLFKGSSAWCTPSCSGDAPCPGGMHCTGFGTFPVDHCHPNAPRGLGEPCSAAALCAGGMRCTGSQGGQQYCYTACPDASACPATHRCVASTLFRICFARCDPLAAACPAHEHCWANLQLGEGVCAPRPGFDGACKAETPCAEGTVCAAGTCRPLCTGPGDCPDGSCTPVSGSPWSACAP